MKVSELVAQLEGHQPDGQVVIQEIDAVSNSLFVVESVMKEEGKIPLLKVRAIGRNPYGRFPETLFKQAFSSKHNKYTAEIGKSPMDGKYREVPCRIDVGNTTEFMLLYTYLLRQ